ncbi:MAG: SGNH/GDSL hydrolase family protein [Bacteroides sp.]|nr:SGNH/GDSL hydrolase family protein [Bacteroides sp.]
MKKNLLTLLACLASTLQLSAQTPMQWKNPMNEPFHVVRGQAWQNELKGTYYRMPDRAEKTIRKAVWDLSRHSAGMSIAFRSDAPQIKIRYQVSGSFSMPHMPSTGVSGVDMYATDINGERLWCSARYAFRDTVTYTYNKLSYGQSASKGFEYEVYLPLYNDVKWLEVGVPEGHTLQFLPASQEKPIVLYGTSIAQGACASRPGMAFGNIIGRKLEHPVVNLGFSGNGQMEPEVFDLLAEIDAQMFILDNMPNMGGDRLPKIYERTIKGVHKLRKKSKAPILLVEHYSNSHNGTSIEEERSYKKNNLELRKAYRTLKKEGVQNLHFLSEEELGLTQDCSVEGWHPNDLGMQVYADAYVPKIKEILNETSEERCIFTPLTQQRDSYNWKERHEQVLALNKEKAPQIVLIGNSITHYWAGEPAATIARGTDSWENLFKGKVVRNMGFGWDRIENALWRIYHGELDGFDAEKIILLMGTNNLEKNTNDEIIDGINELVRAVRHRQPKAQIYVAGILPRAGREARIAVLNETLLVRMHTEEATFIDMSSAFLQPNGRIIKELFTDGLHPNKEGYQRMAKMLERAIKE